MTLRSALENAANIIKKEINEPQFAKGDAMKLHNALQKGAAFVTVEISTHLEKSMAGSQNANVGHFTNKVGKPGNSGQTR